jgi:hypothetical protein
LINLGIINEKTTATLSLDFLDENGQPVTPTSGSYRIDTIAGAVVKAATPFSPTGSTHKIVLSVADNTPVDALLLTEPRVVTITWLYGTSSQGTEEYRYSVRNLKNVT